MRYSGSDSRQCVWIRPTLPCPCVFSTRFWCTTIKCKHVSTKTPGCEWMLKSCFPLRWTVIWISYCLVVWVNKHKISLASLLYTWTLALCWLG